VAVITVSLDAVSSLAVTLVPDLIRA